MPQGTYGAKSARSTRLFHPYCLPDRTPSQRLALPHIWASKSSDFSAVSALGAAADMRITPDLLQRSRKKSLHTFHKHFLVSHFSISLHIFSKSPICVLTRFWTLNVRYDAVGGPTGSKNAPNRFSVKFYPKWDVRPPFSQKIFSENPKNSKKSPRSLRNPSRKKIAT